MKNQQQSYQITSKIPPMKKIAGPYKLPEEKWMLDNAMEELILGNIPCETRDEPQGTMLYRSTYGFRE